MKGDKKMKNSEWTPQLVDINYVNALVSLVYNCRFVGVELNEVKFFQNGWVVTFKGFENADAICHDGSYGSPCYLGVHHNNSKAKWETMGSPWDGEDVSVHSACALAHMLACLQKGEDWRKWEDGDKC